MAQATQTTLGEIKLAGDLTGTAEAPQLSPTGVSAGTYVFPTISVDGKGRITSAHSGTAEELTSIIPGASKTKKGIVKVGSNIEVTEVQTQGYYLISFGGTIVAGDDSGLVYEPCRPYTATVNASGDIQKKLSVVTLTGGSTFTQILADINSQLGWNAASIVDGDIRLIPNSTGAGSYIEVVDDCLFKYLDGYVGNPVREFGKDESTIWVKEASTTEYGVVKVGNGLTSSNGTLSVDVSQLQKASDTEYGVVKVGSGLNVNAGTISLNNSSVEPVIASSTTLGAVKLGSSQYLSVSPLGTLDVQIPLASTTERGVVGIGSNISVSSGVISVPKASSSNLGVVRPGFGTVIDSNGILSLDTTILATSTTPGLIKVGTGLTVSNGIVSVDTANLPPASKSAKGAVRIGANINVTGGLISVPTASTTSRGVVRIDPTKFTIDGSGTLGINSTTGYASSSNTGLVKIGANITVNNGVISVTPPTATNSVKGMVAIGDNINVDGTGLISVNKASTSNLGLVKVGEGLAVDSDGVLSANIPNASYTVKGVVQIGDNIDIDSFGKISIPTATTDRLGVVKPGTGISIDSFGKISFSAASLPIATLTTLGVVKIGSGLQVDSNGVTSIKQATTSSLGAVKIGSGLTVAADGTISLSNLMPGSNSPGVVKLGSTVLLNQSGGLEVSTIPAASTTNLGLVRVGTGLLVNNGEISVDYSNIPRTDRSNSWSAVQLNKVAASTTPFSFTPDLSSANLLVVQMDANLKTLSFNNPNTQFIQPGSEVSGFWTVIIHYNESNFEAGQTKPRVTSWGTKYKLVDGNIIDFSPTTLYQGQLCLSFLLLGDGNILVRKIGTF